jgi:predicted lipid carrier protein YhbT
MNLDYLKNALDRLEKQRPRIYKDIERDLGRVVRKTSKALEK